MGITYSVDQSITVEQFISILQKSSLGERRPIDDIDCLKGMLDNCNLLVTAWVEEELVGLSRCVTDFHYCCYLSDLAVDKAFQEYGVGKQLQIRTQEQLGPHCKIILLAAPAANSYYPHVGYTKHDRCWVLDRKESIES